MLFIPKLLPGPSGPERRAQVAHGRCAAAASFTPVDVARVNVGIVNPASPYYTDSLVRPARLLPAAPRMPPLPHARAL